MSVKILRDEDCLDSVEQELLKGLKELSAAQAKVASAYANLVSFTRMKAHNKRFEVMRTAQKTTTSEEPPDA